MSNEEKATIHRGLKGVYFERSPVSFIDGRAGELRYRGYSIHDLAQHSTFEETAYLLLRGELPTAPELAAFDAEPEAGVVSIDGKMIDRPHWLQARRVLDAASRNKE